MNLFCQWRQEKRENLYIIFLKISSNWIAIDLVFRHFKLIDQFKKYIELLLIELVIKFLIGILCIYLIDFLKFHGQNSLKEGSVPV